MGHGKKPQSPWCVGVTLHLQSGPFHFVHASVLLPSSKSRLPISLYFLKAQGNFCSTWRNFFKVTLAQRFHSPHTIYCLERRHPSLTRSPSGLPGHSCHVTFHICFAGLKGTHDHIVHLCSDPVGPLGSSHINFYHLRSGCSFLFLYSSSLPLFQKGRRGEGTEILI